MRPNASTLRKFFPPSRPLSASAASRPRSGVTAPPRRRRREIPISSSKFPNRKNARLRRRGRRPSGAPAPVAITGRRHWQQNVLHFRVGSHRVPHCPAGWPSQPPPPPRRLVVSSSRPFPGVLLPMQVVAPSVGSHRMGDAAAGPKYDVVCPFVPPSHGNDLTSEDSGWRGLERVRRRSRRHSASRRNRPLQNLPLNYSPFVGNLLQPGTCA